MESKLRERYLANEILKIGDLVEDSKTHEQLKILDRGSNYITVESASGIRKKWITEVTIEIPLTESVTATPDFTMSESGQLKMFGYETKAFDEYLTDFVIEQFSEFSDLYSKHQIIKLLDSALLEHNLDRKYDLLEKVESFYSKQSVEAPIIVEGFKSEVERLRLAQIIAVVAGVPVNKKSVYSTIKDAVAELRKKYTEKKQWEVLWPFFVIVHNAGIHGVINTLPYQFDQSALKSNPDSKPYDVSMTENVTQLLEDNLDELVESFEVDDITQTFSEDEFDAEFLSEEQLDEVLSYSSRLSLGRKMHARETNLNVKRVRAMSRGASTSVLMSRARRMAETMLKRRLFRKDPALMSRQEKERFESGISRRKALVARLATRLIGKVRMLQTARLHGSSAGVQNNSHIKDPAIGAA